VHLIGDRRALMPIDGASGGTWIAASDAGLVMALLNINGPMRVLPGLVSRGLIIPRLIACDSIDDVHHATMFRRPTEFSPFRLVVLDPREYLEIRNDDPRRLIIDRRPLDDEPLMFTSSGLGDALVEPSRRELFQQICDALGATPEAQDAFHAHQWPERPHLSVRMNRADACTASRTVVELRDRHVTMSYEDVLDRNRLNHVEIRQLRVTAPARGTGCQPVG
jgi:hypothetical protein